MADDEKVFLITGASSGIGAATARQAAHAGFRVVLAARSEDRIRALAGELGGDARALAVRCDVAEYEDQEALVAAALDRFGRIDVAFANAGFGASPGFSGSTPEHQKAMILTNVLGVVYTIRLVAEPLAATRGHLLVTGSVAGRISIPGSVYGATKWAVLGLAQNARLELNGSGIRVTVIAPGQVQTPFFDNPAEGRLEADDIARAVLWAVDQPPHVDVNEILVRPTAQQR
jgi:NADP-dependent 3-hydroxy acid dehydrogenase YdfG